MATSDSGKKSGFPDRAEHLTLSNTFKDDFPDTGTGSLMATYVGLHIAGGHVGMPVLVLLFLCSKRIQRPVTVINFCITWILFSMSYCLSWVF